MILCFIIISILVFFLNYLKSQQTIYVGILLSLAFINEVITLILIELKISYSLSTTIYLFLHNILWYLIFYSISSQKKKVAIVIVFYSIISILNFFFLEGIFNFNFFSFIFGALFYIILFIDESFKNLKSENFSYFFHNKFLLIFSPVLFFFGLSFVFGFKSERLAHTRVIFSIELYHFISNFVNFIYYFLISTYIYREKKLQHAR